MLAYWVDAKGCGVDGVLFDWLLKRNYNASGCTWFLNKQSNRYRLMF